MVSEYMERCSISLFRGMQIEATARYHLTPVGMAIIKKKPIQKITNVDEEMEKFESHGNVRVQLL